ncbi:MAG: class I SAM-dependent methyltransferase [Nitrospinota bacterium]|nr:class I SAM-dependent methyltransferase [Nitrospinota bacterium]
MTDHHMNKEYSGTKGKIIAWFMSSWLRELFERVWLGEPFPKMVELLGLLGNETILDAGCGSGFYAIKLAHKVEQGKVIGVDSSPEMLAAFKRRANKAIVAELTEAREGDITALPMDADSVDRAFCAMVWHHIPDSLSAAREMHRVLKPGGVVVVADFHVAGPAKGTPGHTIHPSGKAFTQVEMRAILEGAGFTNVSTHIYRKLVMGRGEKNHLA